MDLMYKDIDTVTRMAKEYKIPMLVANMVQQIYGFAMAQGGGKTDHTTIFRYLRGSGEEQRGILDQKGVLLALPFIPSRQETGSQSGRGA